MSRIDTPHTREARKLQDEGELYEALTTGLLCAEGAARAIGFYREEGRWFQVALRLGELRQQAVNLATQKRRPPLLMPSGAVRN